jgi:ankyrin repeat protein
VVRYCLPGSIRRALDEFPETLAETYEHSLREIRDENWKYAYRLFQFVVVASCQLRVEELADLLALDFDAGPIPTFRPDWRPEDPVNSVLSTCSTLLSLVKVDGFSFIQFSHFSVKTFLTSEHPYGTRDNTSRRYRILMQPAHAMAAQACLGILLHLDAKPGGDTFPLLDYAARNLMDHAQFGNVSTIIQEGLKLLFDPTKPHFSIWMSIHDPDEHPSWYLHPESPSQGRGNPLHYAALYGFSDLANFLVLERAQDINARRPSDNCTPLFMSSKKGHPDVTRLLLWLRAEPNVHDKHGLTPLHLASGGGHLKVAWLLLECGADADARDKNGHTPLHLASGGDHLQIAWLLLDRAADANSRNKNGDTPLHLVSEEGHPELAWLLLDRGADENVRNKNGDTPLHLAARGGHLGVVQRLLSYDLDANSPGNNGSTPLHLASQSGDVKIVQLFLGRGSKPNPRDKDGMTPLHFASQSGYLGVAQLLLDFGADVDARGIDNRTPLHLSTQGGDEGDL